MSVMPNMTVAAPADPVEARAITALIANRPGPAYLRLGKAGEPLLHAAGTQIEFGKAITVVDGADLTLISTGGMLATALHSVEALLKIGISPRVVSMPFLSPLDEAAIGDALLKTGAILTIEEHGPGGLGTLVGECIARSGVSVPFHSLRLAKVPIKTAGTQEQLRSAQGLSVDGIVQAATGLCSQRVRIGTR